ncbi:MAG: C25 family cysteine peptidase [Paludibacteraceae bacterium]
MKKLYLCVYVSLLCFIAHAQTYTYSFNEADFPISHSLEGSIINYPTGFEIMNEPCTPIMPTCVKNILLPEGAVVKGYSVQTSIQSWKTNITLASMSYPVPTTDNSSVVNDCQYEVEKIYPDSVVKLVNISEIDGYQYVTFFITPFRYNAKQKQLDFVSKIDIVLTVEQQLPTLITIPKRHSQAIKHIVDNANDVSLFYTIENDLNESSSSPEYLIITSKELKESFEPLRIWKCQKGINTEIITLDTINAKYTGNTIQLRIKQCVHDYYNKGLRFLLLGGDNTIVPIIPVPIKYGSTAATTPCDWYYGCFDKQYDWDANGNGIYGELTDNVDFNSKISISRLPIRVKTDAQTYIEKLLKYEQAPSNVTSMLLCGEKLWGDIGKYSDTQMKSDNMYANYIAPYWNGSATRFYDTDTDFPEGSNYDLNSPNITTQFNKGYHFIHFATHGAPQNWSIEYGEKYTSSMALNLTNNQPLIITTMACSTNAFDVAEPCLSEAFIRNPAGGAIAYWGSSRAGWGTGGATPSLGASFMLDAWFYKTLFQDISHHFAEIVRLVKQRYVPHTSTESVYRWLMCSTNAIGDAELPIYTAGPFSIENVTLNKGANTLSVSVPIDSCIITLSDVGQGGNFIQTFHNVSAATFVNIPNYCTLVITKHNYIPYIYAVDNCHLQNDTIAQKISIIGCNELNIGNQVIEDEPKGDVIVTKTGELQVSNFGTVNIQAGFEIKRGGKLSIKNGNASD